MGSLTNPFIQTKCLMAHPLNYQISHCWEKASPHPHYQNKIDSKLNKIYQALSSFFSHKIWCRNLYFIIHLSNTFDIGVTLTPGHAVSPGILSGHRAEGEHHVLQTVGILLLLGLRPPGILLLFFPFLMN